MSWLEQVAAKLMEIEPPKKGAAQGEGGRVPEGEGGLLPREVGVRVGALASANDEEVRLFGYGVYEGDHQPPADIVGPFGHVLFKKNPRIRLDSGEVVWGCECWWGPEEKIRATIGKRRVVPITPTEYRAAGKAQQN